MKKPNQAEQGLEPNSSGHFPSQKPALCSGLIYMLLFLTEIPSWTWDGFCFKFCQTVAVEVVKFQFQQIVILQWKNLHWKIPNLVCFWVCLVQHLFKGSLLMQNSYASGGCVLKCRETGSENWPRANIICLLTLLPPKTQLLGSGGGGRSGNSLSQPCPVQQVEKELEALGSQYFVLQCHKKFLMPGQVFGNPYHTFPTTSGCTRCYLVCLFSSL